MMQQCLQLKCFKLFLFLILFTFSNNLFGNQAILTVEIDKLYKSKDYRKIVDHLTKNSFLIQKHIDYYIRSLIEIGKFDHASELLNIELEKNPNSKFSNINLALYYIKNSDLKSASKIIDKLEFLYPTDINVINVISTYFILNGNYDISFKYLNYAKKIEPDNIEILLTLANLYLINSEYDKSFSYLKKVELIESNSIQVLDGFYKYYSKQNNVKKAIEVLEKIIKQNNSLPIYYKYLINETFKSENLDKIPSYCEELKKYASEMDYLNLKLANYYFIKKEYLKAIDHSNRVLKNSKNNNEALFIVFSSYTNLNDMKNSYKYAMMLYKNDESNYFAIEAIAKHNLEIKDYNRAIEFANLLYQSINFKMSANRILAKAYFYKNNIEKSYNYLNSFYNNNLKNIFVIKLFSKYLNRNIDLSNVSNLKKKDLDVVFKNIITNPNDYILMNSIVTIFENKDLTIKDKKDILNYLINK